MVIGVGLRQLFAAYPQLYATLQIGGAAYLLHLAWQIATARPTQNSNRPSRPLRLLEGGGLSMGQP